MHGDADGLEELVHLEHGLDLVVELAGLGRLDLHANLALGILENVYELVNLFNSEEILLLGSSCGDVKTDLAPSQLSSGWAIIM